MTSASATLAPHPDAFGVAPIARRQINSSTWEDAHTSNTNGTRGYGSLGHYSGARIAAAGFMVAAR